MVHCSMSILLLRNVKIKLEINGNLFRIFGEPTQLEYTWLRSLMGRHKDFWQITEDSLDKSMRTFNIDPSMKKELLDLYKILSPFEEVPETLKTLKKIILN